MLLRTTDARRWLLVATHHPLCASPPPASRAPHPPPCPSFTGAAPRPRTARQRPGRREAAGIARATAPFRRAPGAVQCVRPPKNARRHTDHRRPCPRHAHRLAETLVRIVHELQGADDDDRVEALSAVGKCHSAPLHQRRRRANLPQSALHIPGPRMNVDAVQLDCATRQLDHEDPAAVAHLQQPRQPRVRELVGDPLESPT
jgi:hypothetical protein